MSSNGILDDMPWLQRGAIEAMEKFLISRNKPRTFEWGAGGSTIWLAKHAYNVVSVEHNPEWHKKVADRLVELQTSHVQLVWVSPYSDNYATMIEKDNYCWDLILIDGGFERNECIKYALNHLKQGTMIVVDNTERVEEYAEGLALLKDWKRQDFVGDWTTSIFTRE